MIYLKTFEGKKIEIQETGHFYICIHVEKSKSFTFGKKYIELAKIHRFHNNKVINDNGNFAIIEICGLHDQKYPQINSDFFELKNYGIQIYRHNYNAFFVRDIDLNELKLKLDALRYNL